MADSLLEGGKEDSELKEAGKLCHGRSLFIESALIDYDIPILARFDTNKKRATRLADGPKESPTLHQELFLTPHIDNH